jgi:hypothetical protein
VLAVSRTVYVLNWNGTLIRAATGLESSMTNSSCVSAWAEAARARLPSIASNSFFCCLLMGG